MKIVSIVNYLLKNIIIIFIWILIIIFILIKEYYFKYYVLIFD